MAGLTSFVVVTSIAAVALALVLWRFGAVTGLLTRFGRVATARPELEAGVRQPNGPDDITAGAPAIYSPVARPTAAIAGAPARRLPPAVPSFVIDEHSDAGRESRLPPLVVAAAGWHDAMFNGWCASAVGAAPTTRLAVRAAAMRGSSHAQLVAERQDALGAAWDDRRGALYVAVADGLGSLPGSGRVATAAVQAALHLCLNRPADAGFAAAGERLFEAIAAGLRRSFNADQGAATLVVAEVRPNTYGAEVTVHGVGDSEAWLLYEQIWTSLHHEREERGNATRDLPSHTSPHTISYAVPLGAVLVLGSDGFTGALDTGSSALARGLARQWERTPRWIDFLNHVEFLDDYWSDDRGVVAVWIGERAPDA